MENLLFVVGRSASGKTTICRWLESAGFSRISASESLKSLYTSEFRAEPSRIELADYGQALLLQNRLQKFHSSLENEIKKRDSACIDGLRFRLSVDDLARYARRSLLIFLECAPSVREIRSAAQINKSEFKTLSAHVTEVSVDAMRERADLIVDTSNSIPTSLEALEKGLRRLEFI
jgi:dephospho-CoA kinase